MHCLVAAARVVRGRGGAERAPGDGAVGPGQPSVLRRTLAGRQSFVWEAAMLRFRYLLLLAVIPVATALAPAQASVTAARPLDVLINQPASSVCVGKTFTVGVWYQSFSGGSRAYRVDVSNPDGKRILYKHGRAPSSAWKFWKVRARIAGRYRTVYWTHPPGSGSWSPYRARTKAHHC